MSVAALEELDAVVHDDMTACGKERINATASGEKNNDAVSTSPSSPFFNILPAEIRNKIYYHAYTGALRVRKVKTETKENEASAEQVHQGPKIIDVHRILVNKLFYKETYPIAIAFGRVLLPTHTNVWSSHHSLGFLSYSQPHFQLVHDSEVCPLLPNTQHAEIKIFEDWELEGIKGRAEAKANLTALETITVTFDFRNCGMQLSPDSKRDSEHYWNIMQILMIMQRSTEYCNEGCRIFVQEKRLSESTSMQLSENDMTFTHGILETTIEGAKLYISNGWIFRPVSDLIADEKLVKEVAGRLAFDRAREEYTGP